eukprot:scaffold92020_cov17-Tisochrysis_lutea.AAC.1
MSRKNPAGAQGYNTGLLFCGAQARKKEVGVTDQNQKRKAQVGQFRLVQKENARVSKLKPTQRLQTSSVLQVSTKLPSSVCYMVANIKMNQWPPNGLRYSVHP